MTDVNRKFKNLYGEAIFNRFVDFWKFDGWVSRNYLDSEQNWALRVKK